MFAPDIGGDLKYFTMDYEKRGRRVEVPLIKFLNRKGISFFNKPVKEITVLDVACGVPFVWEILHKYYGIQNFVGVDILDPADIEHFLNIYIKNEIPSNNIKYIKQDGIRYIEESKEKYDIIIDCMIQESHLKCKHLLNDRGLLIFEYNHYILKDKDTYRTHKLRDRLVPNNFSFDDIQKLTYEKQE